MSSLSRQDKSFCPWRIDGKQAIQRDITRVMNVPVFQSKSDRTTSPLHSTIRPFSILKKEIGQ